MNSIFASLLSTTESSLLLGFSLAICVASWLGCGIGVIGLTVYPLIRSGMIDSEFLKSYIRYILLTTITAFSIFSLIGMLELGREYLDRAEKASLRNMARAFIQLRDLVNTPFQTIDLSITTLAI